MTTLDLEYNNQFLFAQAAQYTGIYKMSAEETVLIMQCLWKGMSAYECADYLGLKDRDVLVCYHQLYSILGFDRT